MPIAEKVAETFAWSEQHRSTDTLRRSLRETGCFVYGAGGYGRDVARIARDRGYSVHGFVDRSADGTATIDGLPSWSPAGIDPAAAKGSALIIAVNNFKTPIDEIATWAGGRFADMIFVPELPDVIDAGLGNYWQASRRTINDHRGELARLSDMLADERSRVVLEQLACYRITGRPGDHPDVDRNHQYFPADLPMPRRSITVVDCGAFPGDMIDAVDAAGLVLDSWYAFEPDPANFRRLSDVAKAGSVRSAALFPCGVGDTTGTVHFATGGADASHALADPAAGQGAALPIVKVDDVVRAERIDLVKLDIEGFEAAAIDGMADLLARHRPRLAVAVYHKPSDLWDLAFKIDAMLPGGRYALRQHGFNGYDTVLYVDWH